MPTAPLQRKLSFFVITIAVVALILICLPMLEDWLRQSIYSQFNLVISEDNVVVSTDGTDPSQAATLLLSLIVNLLHIIKIFLWMTIVVSVVKLIMQVIFGTALKKGENEVASLLQTIVSVIIYIVAFFIIFQTQYPKIPLAPLFTGSTILGIVVGLALQDTLGNLFAGVASQADQSFQIGDIISIKNEGQGVVEGISWRGVKIRTFQDKLLIISNSIIGKQTVEVAPKGNLNARIVRFNTIYTNSPAKVIQTVREAVRQAENVSPKRRPKVRIWNLGDNGIDWEVKYWITNYRDHNDTDALIRQRIWYAFQRENLDFAYPTRTIYTAKKSEEDEIFVETEDEICERIINVPIFAPLSTEETQKIARTCSVRVFAPEEPIIEKGQQDKSMFIIHRGVVHIQIEENGVSKVVSTLREGDFFGEMSLFTGEPRTANVIADSETQVLEIKPYIMKPILDNNPEVARVISEIIEERRTTLAQEEEQKKAMTEADSKGVLRSIKGFFGID